MRLLLLVGIAGLAQAVLGSLGGCSAPQDDGRGDLTVEVYLPGGVPIDAITYSLTGNHLSPVVEVVPVSLPNGWYLKLTFTATRITVAASIYA